MRWLRWVPWWLWTSYWAPLLVLLPLSLIGGNTPNAALLENLLVWPAALVIGVVFHEGAHALVGRLAGLDISAIHIGSGNRLATFWVGDTAIRVHAWLPSGVVYWSAPKDLSMPRLRMWFGVLAGPVVTTWLCVMCWQLEGDDIFGWWRGFHPMAVLFWANLMMLPFTAFPYETRSGHKTDARLLLSVHATTDEQLAELRAYTWVLKVGEKFEELRFDEADALLRQALSLFPDSNNLHYQAASLLLLRDHYRPAYEAFKALRDNTTGELARWSIENSMAWALFYERSPEHLAEAIELSERGYAAARTSPQARFVRGAVFYWQGEFEQAVGHLEAALRYPLHRNLAAELECIVAMALSKQGNDIRAVEWLNRAEKTDASCTLFVEARRTVRGTL